MICVVTVVEGGVVMNIREINDKIEDLEKQAKELKKKRDSDIKGRFFKKTGSIDGVIEVVGFDENKELEYNSFSVYSVDGSTKRFFEFKKCFASNASIGMFNTFLSVEITKQQFKDFMAETLEEILSGW